MGPGFNRDINAWNVAQVTSINNMFYMATSFNQRLNAWNVGKVTDMREFIVGCVPFNQPLEAWDVGQVTTMYRMFLGWSAWTKFDQTLESWNVGQVTDMQDMFFAERLGSDLSDCNKKTIHDSFAGQVPSVWTGSCGPLSSSDDCGDNWGSLCPA